MMEKFMLFVEGDKITIQDSYYIEDGFYIEIVDGLITLYEIPLFGGNERKIGDFDSIIEAIAYSKTLT